MKKYFANIVLIFALLSSSNLLLYGQKKYDEGELVLKITDVKVADKKDDRAAKMMEGRIIHIYFTPEKQRVDMSMLGGMAKMSFISDVNDTNSIVLMKMMGQKMKMSVSQAMANKLSGADKDGALPDDYKIVHRPGQTKKILQFDTHVVELSYKDDAGNPVLMKYYVTDQIKTPKTFVNQLPDKVDLGGVPLEYEIVMPGKARMKYKAVKFNELKDEHVFDIPDDYQEIDPAMLGGMSGN